MPRKRTRRRSRRSRPRAASRKTPRNSFRGTRFIHTVFNHSMHVAKRCLVAGRVQGVYYRASTQQHARSLGVTGYARNMPDGRVEVLAVGTVEAVDALIKWLWQ